jgi:hypothetical protein
MSFQALQQQNHVAAQKYQLNLGMLTKVIQIVQDHPEVAQLISLAAQLRGNPGMIGQFQSRADTLITGLMAGLDSVMEYVLKAEQSAGVAPSPMFNDLHAGVDTWLAKYGSQTNPTTAPAQSPPPASPGAATV